MILTEQQQGGERSMTLRSATQDKTYKFQLKLNNVPNYDNMKYCESSHGWLAYAQGNLVAITLLNPFTGRTITLPPVPATVPPVRATGSYYIKKVVLSADPSSFPDDYQVLVIYNERVYNADTRIAHFKSGEDTWTLIDSGTTIRFTHAVCYKGQFLVCGGTNVDFSVFEVDVRRKRITQLMYGEQFVRRHEVMNTYLVESSKGLLVRRFHLLDIDRCLIVTVDKLIYDFGDDELTPIPIESIGSDALFLDRNQSICVSALDFPECHPKSIYFTDGIFSLESRQMHWFDSLKPTMSAIWISPTLCVENQPLPTCN